MNTTPRALQEALTAISDESYEKHQELASIAERSGEERLRLLGESKSAKEAEMKWEASEDGKREAYLKIYLKGLSHKRTALIMETKANAGSSW